MAGVKGQKWGKKPVNTHQIWSVVDQNLFSYLKKIAKKNNWSMSKTIKNIIKDYYLMTDKKN